MQSVGEIPKHDYLKQSSVLHTTSYGQLNILEYPAKNPQAIVVCLHGLCCDARIFNYLGSCLSKQGFYTLSVDLFGHGKSDGEIGDTNFEDCIKAIHEIIEKKNLGCKIFILAHSIGCTYGLWYAHKYGNSIDGLILMSPYIRLKALKNRSVIEPSFPVFVKILVRKIFAPKSKTNLTELLPEFLRVGGEEIQQMLRDQELNFYYSYRYIVDVLARRNDDIDALSSIDVPVLFMHGVSDLNIFPRVSEEFYKVVRSKDKKLKLLDCDHWFHDAIFYDQSSPKFSEQSRHEVVKLIVNWLLAHK